MPAMVSDSNLEQGICHFGRALHVVFLLRIMQHPLYLSVTMISMLLIRKVFWLTIKSSLCVKFNKCILPLCLNTFFLGEERWFQAKPKDCSSDGPVKQ